MNKVDASHITKSVHLRRLFYWPILVLALSLTCYLAYRVIEAPRYLVLPVPSPISYLSNGDWNYTEYSTRIYGDGGNRYFIWRRESKAYGQYSIYDFATIEGVEAYFDDWFRNYGWVRVGVDKFYQCPYLPEGEFITQVGGVYFEYRKEEASLFGVEQSACIAIWDVSYDSEPQFNVVIQTVSPSLLAKWRNAFE